MILMAKEAHDDVYVQVAWVISIQTAHKALFKKLVSFMKWTLEVNFDGAFDVSLLVHVTATLPSFEMQDLDPLGLCNHENDHFLLFHHKFDVLILHLCMAHTRMMLVNLHMMSSF